MNQPPPSDDQLSAAIQGMLEQLRHVMVEGKFTIGLVLELAVPALYRKLNAFRVVDEIAILEGASSRLSVTKPAAPFKGSILQGYWHKHYTQAAYMTRNIFGEMHQAKTVERFMSEHEGQSFTPELINKLVHGIVVDGYATRSRESRLTGEWIIFEKTPSGNAYLTLASHSEDDSDILKRIQRYRSAGLM